jgi:hypothetical protein
LNRLWIALGQYLPEVQNQDPIAYAHHERHVVLNEQDAALSFGADAPQ